MLRPVFVTSMLATAVALSGCQSLFGHRLVTQSNTQTDDTQVNSARADSARVSVVSTNNNRQSSQTSRSYSKSAIEYNQWQWEHLRKQALENLQNKSNVMLVNEPVVASEAKNSNVWGYDYQPNTVHPAHWGNISGNELCSTGKYQSPINISEVLIPNEAYLSSSKFKYAYHPQDFVVTNNGRTVEFTAVDPSASKFIVNGKAYRLVKFQYHSPSEHTIMDVNYPLELQFVHINDKGETVIMTSLVNIGEHSPSIQSLIDSLPAAIATSSEDKLIGFDVSNLISKNNFYTYTGSQTTPPCFEKTAWLIGTKSIKASSAQVYNLRSRFYGNNRPVQPLNKRTVFIIK
ncbi:MAG: hypothetical protein CR966_00580 [Pseudomonadales bacterium]|nr:MAG: hypothetical protein CR966_00580 [Pseudomonadales bacterium]